MTAFLYFEPAVPMVVLTVYEPGVDPNPDHVDTKNRRSTSTRCLAWLMNQVVRFERCVDASA